MFARYRPVPPWHLQSFGLPCDDNKPATTTTTTSTAAATTTTATTTTTHYDANAAAAVAATAAPATPVAAAPAVPFRSCLSCRACCSPCCCCLKNKYCQHPRHHSNIREEARGHKAEYRHRRKPSLIPVLKQAESQHNGSVAWCCQDAM